MRKFVIAAAVLLAGAGTALASPFSDFKARRPAFYVFMAALTLLLLCSCVQQAAPVPNSPAPAPSSPALIAGGTHD